MITISHLCFGFGPRDLFTDLDLTLNPGQIYGLLGRNAQGKTTLLKLIAGLRSPRVGDVRVMGMDPAGRHPDLLSKIFFVPEQIELPPLSVQAYRGEMATYYPGFRPATFDCCLSEFGLSGAMRIRALSYGEQKKVALAAALASGCPLMILDEPTNGLDVPSKMQFRQLLPATMSETCTCLIATHQIRELEQLIDPVVILHDGGIVLHETVAAIAEQLGFSVQTQPPNSPDVVYSERVLGGYAVMRRPASPRDAAPDLELLFSAAVNAPGRIRAIFGRGKGTDHA